MLLVLAVVSAVVSSRRERERQESLARWAGQHRWRVDRRPEVDWGTRMPGSNKRGVSLALSGAVGGRSVTIAEYSYTRSTSSTTGSGSSRRTTTNTTTYHYVILVVRLRRASSSVAVYRRGAMSKFGRAVFGERATAIGYEPFDSAFRVAADNPAAVRSVLG